jgi:hypothetical protein
MTVADNMRALGPRRTSQPSPKPSLVITSAWNRIADLWNRIADLWVMSPGGQSNSLLIRRLSHPSTPDFDPIGGRFFAQVLPKFFALFLPSCLDSLLT